ncbi:MAG TPA: sugar phosphate nucleotidyltransferase [Ignavibacteria bacterium]|nr:sugar phosphate nucleotidyltransferase [Ignavibacteria bacterium]
MAGGFGTRLRPLTNEIPKPMVPVVNKPMLEHIFNLLKLHGITDYVMLLYFMPEKIKNFFGDGKEYGVNIKYIVPDSDYGTAGAVKCAEEYINDKFIVISGDVLTDFDLSEVAKFHNNKNATATISLYSAENPLQFGIVLTNEEGKIVRFLEKPSSSEVFSDTINTGIYFFNKEIFNYIPKNENYDFSKDLFPKLLNENIPLYGYNCKGYWRDVGNLEEYIIANLEALKGDLHYINETGKDGNCIGENVTIGKNVLIENSIIGDDCKIGDGSIIRNSVLWNNNILDSKVSLLFDVIGKNCSFGQNTRINDYVFIGNNCEFGKNVFVSSSLRIWDHKKIVNNAKITKSLIYEDTFFNELFTESRISGMSNLQVNPEFAAKLGSVYGAFVGENKRILIGRDIDDISNMIKRAISSGLLSAGIDVLDLQVIPIPMLRQELKSGSGSGGIFVRKSPFDKATTDIIFFDKDGKDLSGNKTKAIERLFFSEEYQRAAFYDVGEMTFPERTNEKYKSLYLSKLDVEAIRRKKFKLVIDYSYGITATIFPNILGELNCEIVSLSAHLDKEKITRSVQEFKKAFDNFTYVIKSLDYDLGFMIDAGGEKIWMVTSDGVKLDGHRFLVLVLKMFLKANPGVKKVAVPVQATNEVDLVAKEFGVEVVRVKDSHYAMMAACDDKDVKFVGGVMGGFLFPEFLYATDGMFSIAKILEIIAKSEVNIQELDNNTERLYMVKENLNCPKEEKGKVLRKFMEDNIDKKQLLIDGVRIILNETDTVLFIPDRDRNIIHLNVETDNKQKSLKILEEYKAKTLKYIPE